MTKLGLILRVQLLATLLSISPFSFSQIYSIGKDWGGLTLYSSGTVIQDSIYVYFSSAASPKNGNLKAKFSDGSIADFKWYKYDDSKPLATRFVEFYSENGVTESTRNNLNTGGYKVSITNMSTTENYYCWVMIDEVVITSLNIDNRCEFLDIITKTTPSAISLMNGDFFRYWDIKSSTSIHSEINTFGNNYFKNAVWHSSNPMVAIPSESLLTLTISNPAPLYDSKYDILITNPFGRELTAETPLITAKAAKADFTLYVDKEGKNTWTEGDNGEAPLALKFDTKSINADSIYWQIVNDKNFFEKGGDSIIWTEGFLLSDGFEILPSEKLIPGTFPVEHIALNASSGCRDTMTLYVVVDSSTIKPEAIPNVFSPNDDSYNDFFLIKEAQTNTASIKSFKVSILSRQGLLIYSYSGNPKEWKGWDGKIEGSKRDAPEGIYFYIMEAVGWDNRMFKRGPYKGFLYLYRGK